jgi:hypothetical protein
MPYLYQLRRRALQTITTQRALPEEIVERILCFLTAVPVHAQCIFDTIKPPALRLQTQLTSRSMQQAYYDVVLVKHDTQCKRRVRLLASVALVLECEFHGKQTAHVSVGRRRAIRKEALIQLLFRQPRLFD